MVIFARRFLNSTQRAIADGGIAVEGRPFLLTVISGALVLIAWYVPLLWWIIFFALVPFIHAIRRTRSHAEVLIVGTVWGCIVLGGATSATLWAVTPASLSFVSPLIGFLLVFLSWLLFFLPLVLTSVAWVFVVHTVARISAISILLLSALWVALEYSRMYLFNLATYAPDVYNPPFFSAGALGYVLADNTSWLQLASVGGVYLMSAVVISVNLFLYLFAVRNQSRNVLCALCVLVLVSILPVASFREAYATSATESVSVGLVSVHPSKSGSTTLEWNTKKLAPLDLLVLPEDIATTSMVSRIPQELIGSDTRIFSTDTRRIVGTTVIVGNVETRGEVVSVHAKSVLAAQGEYISGVFLSLARVLNLTTPALEHHAVTGQWGHAFIIGNDSVPVSSLFCVEMLAPGIGRQRVLHDKSALIALSMSHSQFREAPTLQIDTLRFIKVRTVEAGVPLVASGNATPAYALDRYGRVLLTLGAHGISEGGEVVIPVLSTGER